MNLNFIEAVAVSGYGASYKKLEHEEAKAAKKRKSLVDFFFSLSDEKPKAKRKLSKLLYVLKKDGFISKDKPNGSLFLTVKGREHLKKLDERLRKLLPRVKDYKKEIDGVLKIIAFDIPEREKSKRRWLCSVLKNLGFEMRQKSVWVGRSRLPVYFIKDISRLGLLDCVDIFEVAKKGSLNDLNG